jgi:hypothetical protein
MEATMTLPAQSQPKAGIKKRTIIGLVSGAVALTGGYFVFFYKDENNKTLWQKWTKKDGDAKDETEQKEEEKKPDAIIIPLKSIFPLNANEKNTNVKALQQALIKMGFKISGAPSDYMGANTIKALKDAGYDVPLYKPDFDSIISGKKFCLNRPKLSSDKWVNGRPVYAIISRVVKEDMSDNSNTIINVPKCGIAGIYRGKGSKSGWTKVDVYSPSKGRNIVGYIATATITQFSDGV